MKRRRVTLFVVLRDQALKGQEPSDVEAFEPALELGRAELRNSRKGQEA